MRTVPALLQAHLDTVDTTTTRLLKITLKSGAVHGLSMLDRNVSYDDGEYEGEIDYIATNGFDASTLSADIGYSVDNSEGYALVSDLVPGITTAMADAGELDDATWVCYLVNYEDLSQGHVILDAGDLGEVRTKHGMIWIPELLSYVMRLRQPIGGVWSRTCRAIFGSPANSQTGCGIDLTPLWINGQVLTVGAESDRAFEGDTILDSSSNVTPQPGRVQWLTGVNAGREYAVEEIDGDEVTLSEPTLYAIEVGDTYRIRPDCKKQYVRDCIGVWANGLNFKGEPYIPVGDAASIQIPGAQQPLGGGYTGEPVPPVEDNSAPDAPPAGDPSEWWPNWPIMNCTILQGQIATTLLDYARHDELADKDYMMFQGSMMTPARLQSRSQAIDAIHAINPSVKFSLYTGVQQTLKASTPDSNLYVQFELIASPTEGNPNWYVHRVGQPSSVVESYFDPLTLRMCNVARGAGLNSLGETYVQALWRKWDGLLDDPTWNLKSRLASFFQDDYNARPPQMWASNGSISVTDYDFNGNGTADARADFSSATNAGGRMWAQGHLDSKAAMETRFPGRLLVPNFGQSFVDYLDGDGLPPLPISNHPFYQQFEVGFTESVNNQLGISKSSTAYSFSPGSVSNLMRALAILQAWLKPDANNTITGKGCIMVHATCVNRVTPTNDDYIYARFISALALLNERCAPCVQQTAALPLSLDETLLELGPPVATRSMGSLNQSNVSFTMRTADFSSGVARFHWAVFQKGLVLVRTDVPSTGAYPSADAAVSCTLPTPPAGKKWQRINAATYVNPITTRAMRGQDTTLNSGADLTAISLRPYHAVFLRLVNV